VSGYEIDASAGHKGGRNRFIARLGRLLVLLERRYDFPFAVASQRSWREMLNAFDLASFKVEVVRNADSLFQDEYKRSTYRPLGSDQCGIQL